MGGKNAGKSLLRLLEPILNKNIHVIIRNKEGMFVNKYFSQC